MTKFATVVLLAGAFLIPSGRAAQGPELDLTVRRQAKEQAPPAPVMAPLSIGTAFNASLLDTIDTRRVKPGDPVIAEIVENVSYERTVILPKGTKVLGHVVRATSGGHGRAGSALFIQFDKALIKDGQEVILNAGIQALAVGTVAPLTDTEGGKGAGVSAENEVPPEAPVAETEPASTTATDDKVVVSTVYDTSRR
jgi:hypothetical protein